MVTGGSPPQVRGKRPLAAVAVGTVRITPAGAGKTESCLIKYALTKDHPRRCGENMRYIICAMTVKGSPPQVRGKHGDPYGPKLVYPDHPRRCGEN